MVIPRILLNTYLRLFFKRYLKSLSGDPSEAPALRSKVDKYARRMRADRPGVVKRPRKWGDVHGEVLNSVESHGSRFILYLHGGAFMFGSPRLYRPVTLRLAQYSSARVHVPDYRLAPECPYPAALDDVFNVYQELAAQHGAGRIAVVGDSAGGNLVLSLVHKLIENGVSLPACCVCISPWADLTGSADSVKRNARRDPVLPAAKLPVAATMYADGADLKSPTVSPLFGDFSGFPPLLLHVCDNEILLDDTRSIAHKTQAAGGSAELVVFPKLPHVFHLFADYLPRGDEALRSIANFVRQHTEKGSA